MILALTCLKYFYNLHFIHSHLLSILWSTSFVITKQNLEVIKFGHMICSIITGFQSISSRLISWRTIWTSSTNFHLFHAICPSSWDFTSTLNVSANSMHFYAPLICINRSNSTGSRNVGISQNKQPSLLCKGRYSYTNASPTNKTKWGQISHKVSKRTTALEVLDRLKHSLNRVPKDFQFIRTPTGTSAWYAILSSWQRAEIRRSLYKGARHRHTFVFRVRIDAVAEILKHP